MVEFGSILIWGLFATGVLTLMMSGSQQMGWSRMSLPYMLGTMVTARRSRAMLTGFTVHIVFGCGFAILYALVFEHWGTSGWWQGALLGVYHGLFMLVVVMSILPDIHPRMVGKHHGPTATRRLEPPGFLALNYGRETPFITMAAHIVYGLILGIFYTP